MDHQLCLWDDHYNVRPPKTPTQLRPEELDAIVPWNGIRLIKCCMYYISNNLCLRQCILIICWLPDLIRRIYHNMWATMHILGTFSEAITRVRPYRYARNGEENSHRTV